MNDTSFLFKNSGIALASYANLNKGLRNFSDQWLKDRGHYVAALLEGGAGDDTYIAGPGDYIVDDQGNNSLIMPDLAILLFQ